MAFHLSFQSVEELSIRNSNVHIESDAGKITIILTLIKHVFYNFFEFGFLYLLKILSPDLKSNLLLSLSSPSSAKCSSRRPSDFRHNIPKNMRKKLISTCLPISTLVYANTDYKRGETFLLFFKLLQCKKSFVLSVILSPD